MVYNSVSVSAGLYRFGIS